MPGHTAGGLITLKQINEAYKVVRESLLCVKTPLLPKVQAMFDLDTPVQLYLKLENTQLTVQQTSEDLQSLDLMTGEKYVLFADHSVIFKQVHPLADFAISHDSVKAKVDMFSEWCMLAKYPHRFPAFFSLRIERTVRGVANQLKNLPRFVGNEAKQLVTVSGGNYGKALSFASQRMRMKTKVFMPESAPKSRKRIMESYGTMVEQGPMEELQYKIDNLIMERNTFYLDASNDLNLIAGHASCGIEILEDLPFPDIILVCCGGGGLVSGIASAVKLSQRLDTRVYAVEPENAAAMYESLQQDFPAKLTSCHSVATGLSVKSIGTHTFYHCKEFTDGVLLVTDDEIIAATKALYHAGYVVEPSGAAAFAALMANKVPNAEGKRVVVVLTGGNVLPHELHQLSDW